jgi:hypothetical protein
MTYRTTPMPDWTSMACRSGQHASPVQLVRPCRARCRRQNCCMPWSSNDVSMVIGWKSPRTACMVRQRKSPQRLRPRLCRRPSRPMLWSATTSRFASTRGVSHVASMPSPKNGTTLEEQLTLSFAYYHFVIPHRGLRQRLAQPIPSKGLHGSPQKWRERTPAMAAGLTDHLWTMDELLSFRVPPKNLW